MLLVHYNIISHNITAKCLSMTFARNLFNKIKYYCTICSILLLNISILSLDN